MAKGKGVRGRPHNKCFKKGKERRLKEMYGLQLHLLSEVGGSAESMGANEKIRDLKK